MSQHPDGGVVYAIPQLGQPLFVRTDDGVTANCGQVVGCELCEDAVTKIWSIRVKTTVFPEGFDVFAASGVSVPQLRYPERQFA